MIITLTGQNDFALHQALEGLLHDFIAEHDELAVERIDGEEAEFGQLREAVTNLPFLSSKKMIILRAPGANKQFAEQAEPVLSDAPETNDIVLVEPKLDKRTAYYKFLKKQTDFREFPALDQQGLSRWLVAEAEHRQGSLNAANARYLVERVGVDQQLLSNELEKLLLYDSRISKQTIDLLTEPTPQSTIFQLLEAAFAGNAREAARLYAEQRTQKAEPVQVIAMLSWQLHVLAIIKAAGDRPVEAIAKEAKLNPFVVRKSQGIARKLSMAELKKLTSNLLEIDVAIKRTNIDADEALQHYLLSLST